jgi:hypothetical protein
MTSKEALKKLDSLARWYESDVVSHGYEEAKKHREELTSVIMKSLTELEELKRYPTADEVCKALGEYFGRNVYYGKGYFLYRKEEFYNQPFLVASKYKSGLIEITKNILPPHLITLIGRFYEGIEKVGK